MIADLFQPSFQDGNGSEEIISSSGSVFRFDWLQPKTIINIKLDKKTRFFILIYFDQLVLPIGKCYISQWIDSMKIVENGAIKVTF